MFDLENMSPLELSGRLLMGLAVTVTDQKAGTRIRIARGPDRKYTSSTHLGNAWRVDRTGMTFQEARELLYSIIIRNQEANLATKQS